jgi:hypothetical protein
MGTARKSATCKQVPVTMQTGVLTRGCCMLAHLILAEDCLFQGIEDIGIHLVVFFVDTYRPPLEHTSVNPSHRKELPVIACEAHTCDMASVATVCSEGGIICHHWAVKEFNQGKVVSGGNVACTIDSICGFML